jgi:hypothetical protein
MGNCLDRLALRPVPRSFSERGSLRVGGPYSPFLLDDLAILKPTILKLVFPNRLNTRDSVRNHKILIRFQPHDYIHVLPVPVRHDHPVARFPNKIQDPSQLLVHIGGDLSEVERILA